MKLRTLPKHASRAGFTMVEMLAVILILSILMAVLVTSLASASDAADEKLTEARITDLAIALGTYEGDVGDYPPSRFGVGFSSSGASTNQGIESLVLEIWKEPFDGLGISDDILGNLDGDSASSQPLLEILDMWGNPLAYFHRSDYGEVQTYLSEDNNTGELVESEVVARKHPVTGRWANHQKFQLISAGLDGLFGTADDLGNFAMPEVE